MDKTPESTTMKIAVLITGQLRDYKINYNNHLKHLIEPNNADVFVYACSTNTLHSCGDSLTQKYYTTNTYTNDEILSNVKKIYGNYLKNVEINSQEILPDDNFGTVGYFRTRMQNQIDNIGHGFSMALDYHSSYDIIVRCRPDNSMFPYLIKLESLNYPDDTIYSTIFKPSGHRDLCFFAMSNPDTFKKYCSFKYLENVDPSNTNNDIARSTEHMWEDYLRSIGVSTKYIDNICMPFSGFDKTKSITDFPYRNKDELLIDFQGNFVPQVI